MPQPTSVQVHDGVYGSAKRPARRGAPVSFIATKGSFGSETATSGTVVLKHGSEVVTMDPRDVVWTGRAVSLNPLPHLPETSTATAWRVELTPAGENKPYGPYELFVEASTPALSCPGSVQVTGASEGSPALRGTSVITLTATSGYFGDEVSLSGSVTFKRAFDAAGNPVRTTEVPASVSSWLSTAVTFVLPADLPASSFPLRWEVEVLPLGMTTPCGPYSVWVAANVACPSPTQVVVASAVPAVRGAPVTLSALGGVFGDLLATSGAVSLKRNDETEVPVPASDIVWAPTAVTFILPHDLPDSPTGQPETWLVFLAPRDSVTRCGPYPLSVDTVRPVLLFVAPVIVSEQPADLVAVGLGSNISLRVYANGTLLNPSDLVPMTRTTAGVTGRIPTVRLLQPASAYGTNQLRLPVEVSLYDATTQRESNRLPTTVLLPSPIIGPITRSGSTVMIGDPSGERAGEFSDCKWLGGPARGQIRLYRTIVPDPALTEALAALATDLASDEPSSTTLAKLQPLKAAGEALSFSPDHWTDTGITAQLPSDFTQGTIIVWRDDLPSLAVPVPLDFCDPAFLRSLVSDLYRLSTPAVPIPAGAPFSFSLVETGATNLLQALLADAPTTRRIEFGFALKKGDQDPEQGDLVDLATEHFVKDGDLGLGSIVNVLLRPRVKAQTTDPATWLEDPANADAWTLTVHATVHGLPGCQEPVRVDLPSITFEQVALPVPEMVLAFDGTSFGEGAGWFRQQATYVFLSPETYLPPPTSRDVVIDRSQSNDTQFFAKLAIEALLNTVVAPLKQLSHIRDFCGVGDIPLPDAVDVLQRALWALTLSKGNEVIADATSECNDLGQRDWGWNDRIRSLLMIGPPQGRVLALYENHLDWWDGTGKRLPLRMPEGHIIAAYWSLNTATGFEGTPTPGPQNQPDNYFGNMATGSRWE
ncbi:MAG TPA: hypothetical protein VLA19_12120 [Herpetosiphonaceae bacterium]|nr:hypothetical protein [Herpetosiphonaceae bacterium]